MHAVIIKAVTLTGIALPSMFAVILIFILATKTLHKAFPVRTEAKQAPKKFAKKVSPDAKLNAVHIQRS